MKNVYACAIALLSVFILKAQSILTFHDYSALNMAGDTVYMSQYYGKKVMVVNVASFCAYTPQYTPLQEVYAAYSQAYNFEIIGFPSDDFANQGGNDSDIVQTCNNYGVTFPIMDKVHVASGNIAPVFQWLEQASLNGVANATVTWNFNKFLIDEAGHWVRHYTQATQPDDSAIIHWIVDTPSVVSGIRETLTKDFIEMKSANPGRSIDFALKKTDNQKLEINLFNAEGRWIRNIFTGVADERKMITSDVSELSAGVYLVRVSGNKIEQTLKYVVVK